MIRVQTCSCACSQNGSCCKASFKFRKIDSTTRRPLGGAVFELRQNGQMIQLANSENDGYVCFNNLCPGQYQLAEITPPPGYQPLTQDLNIEITACGDIFVNGVSNRSFVIGNIPLTSVSGQKIWNDDSNALGTRPSSLTINLLQNGLLYESQIIDTTANTTPFTFSDLPAADACGQKYVYSLSEQTPAGYSSEIIGSNIVNTLNTFNITVAFIDDTNNIELGSAIYTVVHGATLTIIAPDFPGYTAVAPTEYTFTNIEQNESYEFHYIVG